MNRDEAIDWLRARGHTAASARDWAMGKTIVIPVGDPTDSSGIQIWPSVLYLYPIDSGPWALLDTDGPDPSARYASLASAVIGADLYAKRKAADRRMPLAGIALEIAGLGIILHSPFATAAIAAGEDYLTTHYWDPVDVARHVNAGSIAGVGTGTPGRFDLRFWQRSPPMGLDAKLTIELGIEVRDCAICCRDLYSMMDWNPACPPSHQVAVDRDGFYRLTVSTKRPASGIWGDAQTVEIFVQEWDALPVTTHPGVPSFDY